MDTIAEHADENLRRGERDMKRLADEELRKAVLDKKHTDVSLDELSHELQR
jgi:hypothetical protein